MFPWLRTKCFDIPSFSEGKSLRFTLFFVFSIFCILNFEDHSREESSGMTRSRSDSHLVKYTNQFLTTNNSFFTLHNQSKRTPGMSPAKISRINRNQKRINQYAISTMKKQELRVAYFFYYLTQNKTFFV